MEPGTPSISKGRYDLNGALDKLFTSILDHLAETDVFGHSNSPSIFIVYAHDNEKEGTANAWCVVLLIEWLKAIRSRTVSDKAPLPLWSPRTGGSESTRNILSNQLCLLPCTEASGDTGIIDRVNKVVVCGSEVLKRYYENEFTPSYIDAIVAAYQDPQDGSSVSVELERRIRNVVEANCSHVAFHHVLTELGFLKLRSIHTKDSHGIIPVALDQDLMAWLPFRANCDLVIKAKSLNMSDLHQLFFKILEQIYVKEHVLIKQCKECYSQASERFRREPRLSESRCRQIIDQEIGKTQTVLRGLESAAFRNQRRDIQQLDSNQLHYNTTKNLRDIRASFKHLLEETASIKTHIDEEKLENLLEWLSDCPFRLHHQSVSRNLMPGSGQWLVNHPTYRHWVQSDSSSMVLVRGVRGCGKSSLFSVVVDQLLQQGSAVAFYYCSSSPSEPDRASPDAILRSILRQLAVDQEKRTVDPIIWLEYQKVADALTSRSKLGRLGTHGCVELLLKLTIRRATYLVLDAIDELQEADRFELMQAFQRIIDESTGLVKVLITSRNDAQIDSLLQSASTISISPAENQRDVEAFVATQLERIVRSRRLLNGSPSKRLLKSLRETLTAGAQEMFLWVQLQIEVLCRKKTEHDIFTALEAGLSANLDKIYANTYQSFLELDRTARSVVQGVISWILYAKSSLTIEALRGALKLSPELSHQSSDLKLPDLFDVCHNLVVLDPAMNILRLCHPSARDFMQRQTMFSEISGNRLLAETCLEQCSRGPDHVSRDFSGRGPISDLALYAGLYWPHHLKLAQLSLPTTNEAFQAMAEFVFDQETADLNIAFVWWLEWMTQALEKLPPYHSLRKTHECLTSPEGPSPLFSASVFGLDSLLDMTLSNMSAINLEQLSETGHTPLYLASTFGHASVVSTLIDHGADANVTCGSYGNPLHATCFRGHLGVVETLLRHGVSPRTPSKVFKNALHAACEGSRANIANLLIKNHGVIQDGQDYDDALQKTAEAGFRDAVEYLMGHRVAREFGRDAGARGHGQNVILATIKKGQAGILKYVLSKPEMTEKVPEDAMAIAAVRGHVEILDLLYERGIDVEAEGKFGSALRSACLQGHLRSVRKLLQMGADPKRSGRRGDSLQAAASKGHVEIIKLLISNGAEVNQTGKPCGTCIQAAAYYGHGAAVELLIQEGAEIYSGGKFKDALHAAVQGGHQDIASFLQENHPPPTKRGIPAIARGDEDRKFWYTELGPSNHLGNQDGSNSPHPEDTEEEEDIDNDEARDEAPRASSGEEETKYGLVFAASIGNMSTIRQELQADEVAEEDVSEALMLAVGKGNSQVTELLLEEALRHTSAPGLLKQRTLCQAAKHKQRDCFQLLADSLKRAVNMKTWALALKAAARTGDELIMAEILALRTLSLPPGLSYNDSLPNDEPYQLAKANFPLAHDSQPPPSTTNACREAIEAAIDSGQHQIARLVWDWVLVRGPEMLEACFHDWEALAAASARLADFTVFKSCCVLLDKCIDFEERSEGSPHDLLLNSVRGHKLDTFSQLFYIIQQGDLETSAIYPSFMEACKQGIDTVALELSSRDNSIRLNADQVTEGVEAAAASGHGRLCLVLLNTLFPGGDEAIKNGAVVQALLAAARAGKSTAIRYFLDHTEIQCQDEFTTYMTRALIVACISGHKEVVELCLEEGADAEMVVSRPVSGTLLGSRDDLSEGPWPSPLPLPRGPMPRGPMPGSSVPHRPLPTLPQSRMAMRAGLSSLPLWDDWDITEEECQELTALQACIEALGRISGMRGLDSDALAPEKRQISIVRLVLDHVTDVSERTSKDHHPLQLAVRAGSSQVVQDLLENGAADGFTPNELGDLILRATERRTRTSIPIILQLLHRGALLPPTDKGSLPLPILGAIGDAIQLLSDPERGSFEQLFTRSMSKRGPFKSDKPARELMNNGMRELIQIMFRRLPRQRAIINVFGELLHMAAMAGDLSTVRLLIKQSVDVNYINMPNLTPLGSAAEFGHVQVIKALLKAGAKVHPMPKIMVFTDWDTQEPAVRAITGGHASALRALLDGGVNPNFTPGHDSLLVLAAQRNPTEFMRLLLKYGADLKKEPLALIAATQTGNLDMVKLMLDAGADVNAMDTYGERLIDKRLCSPLYVACEESHLQVALELLKRGADASLDVGDRDGLPLVVAARHGQLDIIEALLERGASPTRRSKGIEAAPIEFRFKLAERDVEGGSAAMPRGSWPFQDTIMDEADYMCFPAEGKVYLNAIESACTGQKGARVSLQILNILLQAIRSDEEWQVACSQATQIVTDNRNSRLLEGLLPYIAPDSVGLDYACRCGSVKVVQSMLEQGVNVNATLSEDQVALQVAIDYGHFELVQFLVANGANLKGLQDKGLPLNLYWLVASVIESYVFITPKEQKSITKLELAVESLLKVAQDCQPPTQQDQEFLDKSLILACHVGSVEMASSLFKIGAKLDSVTDLSRHIPDYYPSPALAAIECNQPRILKSLLQWDSDPTTGVTMFHSLRVGVEACLGKTSPVLLQTFLEYAGSLNISDRILLLAMEKETWNRPCGESDLEIILEFCPSLTPSEEVLVTLSASPLQDPVEVSQLRCLFWSALSRSSCGVTARMLRAVSREDIWGIFHDYYRTSQSPGQGGDTTSRGHDSGRRGMKEEFRAARKRIKDNQRTGPGQMIRGGLQFRSYGSRG